MGQQRNLTNTSVLSAAVDLIEEKGLSHLSLQDLALRLGVKPPSLYNHINGLDDVRKKLVKEVLNRMETVVRDSAIGHSGEDALKEMALAYRRFAKKNPELYKLFATSREIEVSEIEEAVQSLSKPLIQILRTCGLDQKEERHFIRLFHSGLHGFVSLETAGFFRSKAAIDESFNQLIQSHVMLLNKYKKEHIS